MKGKRETKTTRKERKRKKKMKQNTFCLVSSQNIKK